MGLKLIFSIIFIFFAISLLILYWFIPFNTIDFGTKSSSSNFSLESLGTDEMQFYPNMRFPNTKISYKIYDCTMQKEDDMKRAFNIISEKSVLDFYPVVNNEEIKVTCDSKTKIKGGIFIAGEGGPTNITRTENFNVISHGMILLIRDSSCPDPNVAIHELLHVLGFEHSSNPNNIMYNFSNCRQTIGQDTVELINTLYSVLSYADLSFEDVSAVMNGKYLDVNMSIRNHGLKASQKTRVIIYADDKQIKEVDLNPLDIGYGTVIMLTNVWVKKISINELEFLIDSDFDELEKNNNKVTLEIKK